MSEISQKLGFDAQGAISALDTLNDSLEAHKKAVQNLSRTYGNFNKKAADTTDAMRGMAGLGSSFQNTATQASNAASKTTAASDKIGRSTKELGTDGALNVSLLSKSLDTLVRRVVATQLVVAALGRLKRALADSVQSAIEFQGQIELIRSIAGPLGDDIDGLKGRLSELAIEFNQPLSNTLEGFYRTVSSQAAEGAENFTVLSEAMKLAKVTGSTADQSIGAVTTVLNGFNLSAEQSDEVAGKLFKTLEFGIVRLPEIARGLGRVAKPADQLGVSLEEVLSTLSLITQQGTSSSEAFTQISGMLIAFTKPSEAMRDSLEEIGYESGTALLEANGLQGGLQKLIATTDGSADSIAKLFPRVRGLRGVLNQLGEGADEFSRIFEGITEFTNEEYQLKVDAAFGTDAEKVTSALNELKIIFTEEFGQDVLSISARFLDFAGAVGVGDSAVRALVGSTITLTTAVGLLGFSFTDLGKGISDNLAGKLGGANIIRLLGFGALGVGIGAALGDVINREIDKSINSAADRTRKAADDRIKIIERQTKEEVKIAQEKYRELERIFRQHLAKINVQSNDYLNPLLERIATLTSQTDTALGKVVKVHEARLSQLQSAEQSAYDGIEASQKRSVNARANLEDELFNRQLRGLSEKRKFSELVERAQSKTSEASRKLARARTEEEVQAANALFEQAKALNSQADSLAQNFETVGAQNMALRQLKSITTEQLGAERALQELRKHQADEAKKAQDAQKDRVIDLIDLQKRISEGMKAIDEDGKALSGDARQARVDDINSLMKEFRELAINDSSSLTELLDVDSYLKAIDRGLTPLEQKRFFNAEVDFENLSTQIQDFFDNFDAELNVTLNLAERATGQGFERSKEGATAAISTISGNQQEIPKLEGELKSLEEQFGKSKQSMDDFIQSHNTFKGVVDGVIGLFRGTFGDVSENDFIHGSIALERLQKLLGEAGEANLGDDLKPLVERYKELVPALNEAAHAFPKQAHAMKNAQGEFEEMVRVNQEYIDAQARLEKINVDPEAMNAFEQRVESLKTQTEESGKTLKNLQDAVKPQRDVSTASGDAANNMAAMPGSLSAAVGQSAALAANMAAAASSSANVNTSGGGTKNAALGGHAFLANGGFRRGTDSIPASLSKDEYVLNARSSRKFFPEIQAMNAGVRPSFKQNGGDNVTNIGDININMRGTDVPQHTGRAMAAELRRELRRNTSKL